MPLLPFGEWRPDVSDYEASTSVNVQNVLPRGDGYGPFPGLTALSASLGGQCRGAFVALNTDGSVTIFAATATDLYRLDNTAFTWSKVSLGGGPYSAISAPDQWRFVQFNRLVIAVQANVVPQVWTLGTSTAFANLAGSPPQARYVDVVGRFVVLSGLLSNPQRVQWSGLNDVNGASSWTPGINSSDLQDLPDGGFVRGVAGGEAGIILQDTAIRRMTYVPGSPVIFNIERISQDKGLFGPYSLVRAGERIFFYSAQGFHRIDPGGFAVPIGRERVDRTFLADLDTSNLQLFVGAADPRSSRIFWTYKSVNGATSQFDKLICYDWVLDRFTPIKISGEYLVPLSQPGITLEGLDALAPGGSLDAMTQSLDNFATSSPIELGAFDTGHRAGFLPRAEPRSDAGLGRTGHRRRTDQAARLPADHRCARCCTARCRFATPSRRRRRLTGESLINAMTGRVNLLKSTRYARGRCRIPAGTAWSFIAGIEPDVATEGKR